VDRADARRQARPGTTARRQEPQRSTQDRAPPVLRARRRRGATACRSTAVSPVRSVTTSSTRSPCSSSPWSSARAPGCSPTPAGTSRSTWSTRESTRRSSRSRSTVPPGARSTHPPRPTEAARATGAAAQLGCGAPARGRLTGQRSESIHGDSRCCSPAFGSSPLSGSLMTNANDSGEGVPGAVTGG
jgi:hypothetical protein